jgi:hypothetical protein
MTIRQEKGRNPLPPGEEQGFYYGNCLLCSYPPTAQG